MTQSFELVTKFQPILDEVYKVASLTARMDALTKPVDFAGANVVKVFKTTMGGLGTYSRLTGYPEGEVIGSWEALTLLQSRGREFSIDRMDDEETLGMAFGTLVGQFMRTKVVPEVDAYRFAKYASWSQISTTTAATLTSGTVLAAIDAASLQMDEDEVPSEGRLLYVSSTVGKFIDAVITRTLANESSANRVLKMLDDMTIIRVPQARFYTIIDLEAGATASATGGYSKNASGVDINFLLIHPPAVLQATKHAALKIFGPDENQDMDATKVQYRLYHDAFVYTNMVDGIYLHKKAT
jgi:hypothetical protein